MTAPRPVENAAPVALPERARITARSEKRKRPHLVGVRLDDDQRADLDRLCALHDMNGPELLRAGLALLLLEEARRGC